MKTSKVKKRRIFDTNSISADAVFEVVRGVQCLGKRKERKVRTGEESNTVRNIIGIITERI